MKTEYQRDFLFPLLLAALLSGCASAPKPGAALRPALTFHVSFDNGPDADYALGDRSLYHAGSFSKRSEANHGLPATGEVLIAKGAGRFGDALRFTKKRSPLVFFQANKNLPYTAQNWSGTVSFWLSTDPGAELEPGFCDPVQITPRAWNDAAFFVEFEKRTNSIPFRLGAYADLKVWNPQNRDWNSIPFDEKPLVAVANPPFGRSQWTHVVFTFDNFNTGRADGVVRLYLNGQFQGALTPRRQTFTWDPEKTLVMLGLSYIGLFDELSIFDRALSEAEVQTLHALAGGVRTLLK